MRVFLLKISASRLPSATFTTLHLGICMSLSVSSLLIPAASKKPVDMGGGHTARQLMPLSLSSSRSALLSCASQRRRYRNLRLPREYDSGVADSAVRLLLNIVDISCGICRAAVAVTTVVYYMRRLTCKIDGGTNPYRISIAVKTIKIAKAISVSLFIFLMILCRKGRNI